MNIKTNYAQQIVQDGGVSVGASVDLSREAVIGTFDGLPVAVASPIIWKEACGFLGLPVYALDEVLGYISSGYANVRAIAQQEQMKIIDSPAGVGVRLQPLVRMGFRSFYATANQIIATPNFDVSATITLAGGVIPDTDPNYGGNLLVRGKNSRTARSNDTTLATVKFGGETATYTSATKTWAVTGVTAGAGTQLDVDTTTSGLVEVVNWAQLGLTAPVKGVDGLLATISSVNKPTKITLRVTAPDGTATNYFVTIAYDE